MKILVGYDGSAHADAAIDDLRWAGLPEKAEDGIEYVRGDLGDPEAIDRLVRGAKTVFHVGATMKGGWPEHERGTIEGTRNVLAACRKHAVGKLVHVSSLSVIDWAGAEAMTPVLAGAMASTSNASADMPRP